MYLMNRGSVVNKISQMVLIIVDELVYFDFSQSEKCSDD